ncbi:MAG: DnaJ C-terminal domain-containing protein [Rubricoccaceae bacterium]
MSETTDFYRVLRVAETASEEEIKQAYRRLAHAYHPDHNAGDAGAAEHFRAIQEAYDVLGSPESRRAYDRARRSPFYGPRSPMDGFVPPFPLDGTNGDFPDPPPFDPFFAPPYHMAGQGRDTETIVNLSFDQAIRGGHTEVRLANNEVVRLAIPQGVRSGVKIRVRGHGEPGPNGDRGDLYVTFRVEPSPRFRREGNHLHIVETISAFEAIFGTTRSITNAYGQTIRVPIAPGTQPGERLRLRGQGVASRQGTGDLFVEIEVTIPRSLTPTQRKELEACAQRIGVL